MILLHVCCAPCAGGCVEKLLEDQEDILLYFSNSNLVSREEFDKRLDSVRIMAEHYRLVLEIDPYDHEAWLREVRGLEDEPEYGRRCPVCFRFSLGRAAARAAAGNMDFATTLTVSPRKSSALIFSVGREFPGFREIDFKKGGTYQRSCAISRELGFYRQNFCGCPFSVRQVQKTPDSRILNSN